MERLADDPPIRIGAWYQGPTGRGQGGWTAHRFASRIGVPVTISLRSPVPLETDLAVVGDDEDQWRLVDAAGDEPTTIMVAEPDEPAFPSTDPVDPATAAAAGSRFGEIFHEHPVPYCFSCGIQPDSMGVHAGRLPDGRFATDWRVPDWAVGADGVVDDGVVWAAADCVAAWYANASRDGVTAVTARYAVEVTGPIEPATTYALVGWAGDHADEWDGRKRHAASAVFAPDGRCVARAVSLWIAVDL